MCIVHQYEIWGKRQWDSNLATWITKRMCLVWMEARYICEFFSHSTRKHLNDKNVFKRTIHSATVFFFLQLFLKPLALFGLRDKKTKLSIKRKLEQVRKKLLALVQMIASLLISEFVAWSDSQNYVWQFLATPKLCLTIFQPNVSSFPLVHQLFFPII